MRRKFRVTSGGLNHHHAFARLQLAQMHWTEECMDYWMEFEKPLVPTNTRMKRWQHIREVKSDGISWTRRTRRRAPETFSSFIDHFKDSGEHKPPTCGRATSDQSRASVELQVPDVAEHGAGDEAVDRS
jgi:hypothetical protein